MESLYKNSNNDNLEEINDIDEQRIISAGKFILLSIISLGVYDIWWMYKTWRFFQQKEKLDIVPAARALFSIIFVYALLIKIGDFSKEKEYSNSYYPSSLAAGYIVANLLARLPDPFWLISLLSFAFLVPAFNALNFAKQNSNDFIVTEQTSFNRRQIVLIVIGTISWVLILLGLLLEDV